MRRRKDKWRARAVRISCIVAYITFMVSACMLDSMTWIPFIICCVSMAWLLLVAAANDSELHRYNSEELGKDENGTGN